MAGFKVIRNIDGDITAIDTSLSGYGLLGVPKLNKGCAFTREERQIFKLEGLLPHQVETLEQQSERMYAQYQEHKSNLGKNIYLNVLNDYNETLFYKLVSEHLEEMLPIIYTPTVGEAVERFSLELRKPRGLYISYPDKHHIDKLLANRLPNDVDLIVVTDGEAVLGLGDQGIGGIIISNAKLMVYTLCGGINPHRVLPIQLDVGTNNHRLLADPMYLGWRHERISGAAYDEFIDAFVNAVYQRLPKVFLHWEDVGRDNARRILARYQEKLCTFNGDMQGTGTIALACVLAAAKATGIPLTEHRFVIFGAGTAGVGISDQIKSALIRNGLSEKDAAAQFWLIDKNGLIVEDSPDIQPFQKSYVKKNASVNDWELRNPQKIELYDVVKNAKPTILIGTSSVGGAFTEEIVKLMAKNVALPTIMPLSNPNAKAEAKPEDLLQWTEGKVIIATGSPFPEVAFEGRQVRIAQSNNAFAFPGIGLGAIAVKARCLTDDMLWAATEALSDCSPIFRDKKGPLLPKLSEARAISRQVALSVALQARKEGVAEIDEELDLNQAIKRVSWEPKYYPYRKI